MYANGGKELTGNLSVRKLDSVEAISISAVPRKLKIIHLAVGPVFCRLILGYVDG